MKKLNVTPERKIPGAKCRSCGKLWVDHAGMEITCRQLQDCISALKAISTWAGFDIEEGRQRALDPFDVRSLVNKVFNNIGVKFGVKHGK